MSKRSNSMNGGTAVTTGEFAVVRAPEAGAEGSAAAASPLDPSRSVQAATILFAISPVDAQLSWSSNSTLVQMLADLVAASGATVGDASEGVLAAATPSPLQALVLGVRAVRLATQYARFLPEGIRAFTVAIVAATEKTDEKGINPESALRQVLAGSADGWRILLAGETLSQLRTVPGLQSRKLPSLTRQKVEIHELILPAITPETKTAEVVAMEPVSDSGQLKPLATREMPQLVPRAVAADELGGAGKSKMPMIVVAAAVLLIGSGVAAKVLFFKTPPVAVAPATPAAPASAPPVAVDPAVAKPAPPAPAPAPPPTTTRAPRAAAEADARTTAPPKGKGKAADVPPPAPATAENAAPHGGGGYTADQLKAILDRADKLTANGKYEEAIRSYNVVLAADPGNSRAKEGKERAVTNMNMP